MVKYHDVKQNDELWFELRAKMYMTSSQVGKVMANFSKAFGEPAKKYAVTIATQLLTGKAIMGGFTNSHMERGHEQEPLAIAEYERQYFCTVDNGGFVENGLYGDSPDGLIDDDGVAEVKSVIASVHYANMIRKAADPAYKWQYVWHLYVTGRKWVDFISYCPEFPRDKVLFVHRMHRAEFTEQFKMLDIRMKEFIGLVDSIKDNITNGDYYIDGVA